MSNIVCSEKRSMAAASADLNCHLLSLSPTYLNIQDSRQSHSIIIARSFRQVHKILSYFFVIIPFRDWNTF